MRYSAHAPWPAPAHAEHAVSPETDPASSGKINRRQISRNRAAAAGVLCREPEVLGGGGNQARATPPDPEGVYARRRADRAKYLSEALPDAGAAAD
ncbi:MAG: hypothetical protein U5P41_07115 [Gammaproteobacteria bacterium]|nr:hypothetical protein [Gammaproteobacteria bacterium]